jgi:hypothetical protein
MLPFEIHHTLSIQPLHSNPHVNLGQDLGFYDLDNRTRESKQIDGKRKGRRLPYLGSEMEGGGWVGGRGGAAMAAGCLVGVC